MTAFIHSFAIFRQFVRQLSPIHLPTFTDSLTCLWLAEPLLFAFQKQSCKVTPFCLSLIVNSG